MTTKKIALFIDADNISAKFGKQIIETLERRGEIFIRRIYGNWEKISLHGWNDCILNFSLRAVQQPDFATGKNATDMSLAIDAMDVLHGGKAEIFALVSNDSDFTPLAVRLREGGMKIIGLGNANASGSFRAACDEFINLDEAEKILPAEPPPKVEKKSSPAKKSNVQLNLFDTENISAEKNISPAPVASNPKIISISDSRRQSERDKKFQQIHNALHESAKLHGDAFGFTLLNCAGAELKEKNLGFTVRDFGYSQLKDFLSAFPKLYELKQESTSIFYRCRTNENPTNKLEQLHKILRETAAAHNDLEGFTGLCRAGSAVAQKKLAVKDSGYTSWSKFISAFPKLYEVKKVGTLIYYRCK